MHGRPLKHGFSLLGMDKMWFQVLGSALLSNNPPKEPLFFSHSCSLQGIPEMTPASALQVLPIVAATGNFLYRYFLNFDFYIINRSWY
jgi:hypothetical protein